MAPKIMIFGVIFGVMFLIVFYYFLNYFWSYFGFFLDQNLYVLAQADPAGAFLEALVVKVLVLGRLGLILGSFWA